MTDELEWTALYDPERCNYANCQGAVAQYWMFESAHARKIVRLCDKHQLLLGTAPPQMRPITQLQLQSLQFAGSDQILDEAKRTGVLKVRPSIYAHSLSEAWRAYCLEHHIPGVFQNQHKIQFFIQPDDYPYKSQHTGFLLRRLKSDLEALGLRVPYLIDPEQGTILLDGQDPDAPARLILSCLRTLTCPDLYAISEVLET